MVGQCLKYCLKERIYDVDLFVFLNNYDLYRTLTPKFFDLLSKYANQLYCEQEDTDKCKKVYSPNVLPIGKKKFVFLLKRQETLFLGEVSYYPL